MNRHMTRNEVKRDLLRRILTTVALAALLVVVLVTLAITGEPEEHGSNTERWAQYKAQERYYDAFDIYGDVEGAVESARVVFEKEARIYAEN